MPRDAITLALQYTAHLRYLDITREKMERLFTNGVIVRRDIEQVYVGLYMDCMTSLETVFEDLFVGLLSGRYFVSSRSNIALITFRNRRAVRPMVYGGRRYVDWIPYDQTIDRAKIFFQNGEPFTNLNAAQRQFIEQCALVRNALAHKSMHAKRRFENGVLGNQQLTPRERTPAGYLRGTFRVAPTQTRYEHFTMSMAAIAQTLCS